MEIGILTFWETQDNYGQILQGYALQTYLKAQGHDVYVIRYDHDGRFRRAKKEKYSKIGKFLKALMIYPAISYLINFKKKKVLRERLAYNNRINVRRKFDQFRDTYFNYSKYLYYSLQELQKTPPKADIYIAGSDQIWGWTLKKHNNRAFFLDFGLVETKRISYAPSFAMEVYPTDQIKMLTKQLSRFDAISVREKTGVKICNSVGFTAEWVCDPTMLLMSDDYRKLFSLKSIKPYIFIYSLNISNKEDIYWSQIKKLSETTNTQIKVTVSSGHIPANELFEGVVYDYSTPECWLSNIANAEFVITTSFHGVVFCIIFNKKFAFVPLKGKYSKGNNRVIDLLELLELRNNIIGEGNNLQSIIKSTVNWERTNQLLDAFRLKSQIFINSNIR